MYMYIYINIKKGYKWRCRWNERVKIVNSDIPYTIIIMIIMIIIYIYVYILYLCCTLVARSQLLLTRVVPESGSTG